jgi:hypothetical protein
MHADIGTAADPIDAGLETFGELYG